MLRKSTFILKPLTAAVLLCVFTQAQAMRLGEPVVLSHIGEPLRVTIPVIDSAPEELSGLQVVLADGSAYSSNKLKMPGWAKDAVVSVDFTKTGANVIIRGAAQKEPISDLLVNLTWAAGRMQQAVSLIIDPPEAAPVSTPQVASFRPNTVHADDFTKLAQQGLRHMEVADIAPLERKHKKTLVHNQTEGIKVKGGDTLTKLVTPEVSEGVSLEQLLVAYTEANREAFIKGDMNRLKSGVILKKPTSTDVQKTTDHEAKRIVLTRSNHFGNYASQMASGVMRQKGAVTAQPTQSARGKIELTVTEKTMRNTPVDMLKLSQAGSSTKDMHGAKGGSKEGVDTEVEKYAKIGALKEEAYLLEQKLDLLKRQLALQTMKAAALKNAQDLADKNKAFSQRSNEPVQATKASPATKSATPSPQQKKVIAPAPPAPTASENDGIDWFDSGKGAIGILAFGLVGIALYRRRKNTSQDKAPAVKMYDPDKHRTETTNDDQVKTEPQFALLDELPEIQTSNDTTAQYVTPVVDDFKMALAAFETATAKQPDIATKETSILPELEPMAFDEQLALAVTDTPMAWPVMPATDEAEHVTEIKEPAREIDFPELEALVVIQNEPTINVESSEVRGETANALELPDLDFLEITQPEAGPDTTASMPSMPPLPSSALAQVHPTDAVNNEVHSGVANSDKLSLAKLYIDLKDYSGATELLNDVIRKGSPMEQETADELLTAVNKQIMLE